MRRTIHPQPVRGPITDLLVSYLSMRIDPVPFGDGKAPPAGGWAGSVGQGEFIGYAWLSTGMSRPRPPDSIADPDADAWTMSYGLNFAGGLRKQADDMADTIRQIWQELPLETDLGQPWRILTRSVDTFGELRRRDVNDNVAYWEGSDSATLVIAKMRAT